MHERVILWPAEGSSCAILTLDSDIYVEQLSGDQVQEVHAFHANGALPRNVPLLACRFRSALARAEMREALLLGRAEVAANFPGRALSRPTRVLWRQRPEVLHRCFGPEDGQELPRLLGEVTPRAEPLLLHVELLRVVGGTGVWVLAEDEGISRWKDNAVTLGNKALLSWVCCGA